MLSFNVLTCSCARFNSTLQPSISSTLNTRSDPLEILLLLLDLPHDVLLLDQELLFRRHVFFQLLDLMIGYLQFLPQLAALGARLLQRLLQSVPLRSHLIIQILLHAQPVLRLAYVLLQVVNLGLKECKNLKPTPVPFNLLQLDVVHRVFNLLRQVELFLSQRVLLSLQSENLLHLLVGVDNEVVQFRFQFLLALLLDLDQFLLVLVHRCNTT
jgi:hypothetical protein